MLFRKVVQFNVHSSEPFQEGALRAGTSQLGGRMDKRSVNANGQVSHVDIDKSAVERESEG
jgi:hypothetical protein